MKVIENKLFHKTYELMLNEQNMGKELKKYFPKIEDVFCLMGKEDNLIIRHIEGKIDLLLPLRKNNCLKKTLKLNLIN